MTTQPATTTTRLTDEAIELWPDDRVMVFDNRLWKNDFDTPLSVTLQPATILRRYGMVSALGWNYPDLVDVRFDHDGRESRCHFTDYIRQKI